MSTLYETLTHNPALADDLLVNIHRYALQSDLMCGLPLSHAKDKDALRSLVLAWAQRVEAHARHAGNKPKTAKEATNEPDFSL